MIIVNQSVTAHTMQYHDLYSQIYDYSLRTSTQTEIGSNLLEIAEIQQIL